MGLPEEMSEKLQLQDSQPLPKPLDLSHHLSRASKARSVSKIKALYKYITDPAAINMAGGMPFPAYFPFDTLEANVALPTRYNPDAASTSSGWLPGWTSKPKKQAVEHLKVDKFAPKGTMPVDKIDLASALQYGTAEGYPALLNEVRKISAAVHGEIPYDSPQIIMSCGSTDSISKSMMMLLDPDEFLLTEEYAFGTAIGTMEPWGVQAVPIKMDDMGMLPGALREALENWDDQRGTRPHVLYTITMGQNPTGGVLSLDRRKEIYKICQDFDICIVEDDPYWYLQFDRPLSDSRKTKDGKYPFLQSMTPSYLKIDTDGRVIRLDTFSKTVAPGCRCGWITAQPLFIERMTRHAENTTQQPSGFVQSMLASLLKTWTLDGWVTWLEGLRDQYEHRRNVMCDALAQGIEGGAVLIREVDSFEGDYLHVSAPATLCTFVKPAGGMFVWLRVHIEQHPRFKVGDKAKLMEELWIKLAAEAKIVVSPGWIFSPNEEIARNEEFFRFCFAAIPVEDIRQACLDFGKVVRQFFEETT